MAERPIVIVTRKLPDVVETRLRELFDARLNLDDKPFSREELIEAVKTANVLVPTVTDRIDRGVLSQAGSDLKLIAQFGTGVDNIDLETARNRSIIVTNTPGVLTEDTADIDRYLGVLRRVAARDGFALHDRAYFERLRSAFGSDVHLTMARVGDRDVGALLVIRRADRAWEMYGGWSGEHAEERPFYLLKWRSIARMRELGVTRYDMWGLTERGVSADRIVAQDDPLAGVEQFKVGFGGEIVSWVGAIDTPVRAALYPLWRLAGRRRLAASA